MRIVGLEKNSVVDFPGQLAAVLFSPGCNLDCYYCHNRAIIGGSAPEQLLSRADIFAFLRKRQGLLDGVVFTGGEPTLQTGLAEMMSQVKELGYLIKLDTNGTNPTVLRELIDRQVVDYVAMDLKAPFHKYAEICGQKSNTFPGKIRESIALLLTGVVAYEFRTTVVPELTKEDVFTMAEEIRGAKLYVLQQYRMPENVKCDNIIKERLEQQPHKPVFLRKLAAQLNGLVEKCETRGL